MSRPVVLSNGRMLVGLNQFGFVHDLYYPYIGLENHVTARLPHHKIGIWVDGTFSWIDSIGWQRTVDFDSDALVSNIAFINDSLGIKIFVNDCVDAEHNVLIRNFQIVNEKAEQREVRLFLHQVFQIANSTRGDTAMYVPEGNYILDYKGRNCFLVYARDQHAKSFDQYSIGLCGIEGRESTFRDAEDGELSGNAVEHGVVDSTIRLSAAIEPHGTYAASYWIVAAPSHQEALRIHDELLSKGAAARVGKTKEFWHKWLLASAPSLQRLPADQLPLAKKSLLVIKAHTDRRGSILASSDSEMLNYARDNYSYFWPRDGAYAIWPLMQCNMFDEAKAMFEFCRDTLHEDGYMQHKYQPDRAIGSTWHPLIHGQNRELAIQEDETASVILMVREYLDRTKDQTFVQNLYTTLVQPATNFLERYIDASTKLPHASYDLWEEKFATHTYTIATVYGALNAASSIAEQLECPDDAIRWDSTAQEIAGSVGDLYSSETQSLRKSFLLMPDGTKHYDETVDVSSVYGAVVYGLLSIEDSRVVQSIETIEKQLLNSAPVGGVPRYENDRYAQPYSRYKGNPWFVTTLWLAQLYAAQGKREKAQQLLAWCAERTLSSGVLAEQVDPDTSDPISVAPLVWSHAEFVRTALLLHTKTS